MTSFDTARPIVLSIDVTQGTVHVIAGDRTDTVVSVSPSNPDNQLDLEVAQNTRVDLTNDNLTIATPKRRGIAGYLGIGRSGSVDVTVELPERSSLTAEAGFADFRCDGHLGDVEVKTGAGNVLVDRVGAARIHSGAGRVGLEVSTGNANVATAGDVTIGTIGGDAEIKNLNGKTLMGRVEGDVRVKSANGDVTIGDVRRDVMVTTANGAIRLGQVTRGSASIETASGGLEIGVKEGTAAWIDANTRFGQIHNTLTPADDPEQSAERIQVHARTTFGDILITRSKPEQGEK